MTRRGEYHVPVSDSSCMEPPLGGSRFISVGGPSIALEKVSEEPEVRSFGGEGGKGRLVEKGLTTAEDGFQPPSVDGVAVRPRIGL